MIKLFNIVGARPQIIKSAAISRAIREKYSSQIDEIIIHTGQHYDEGMSEVFFTEMQIPRPKYNLNVGSGMHGEQTAKMIDGLEKLLLIEKPNGVIVYGDTNSTLAAAVAASKMHIPIAHIEAGLRSFNKLMPEEINRIMCDHASTFLFSPTKAGMNNLLKEGFSISNSTPYTMDNPCVIHCGDVMYDNSLFYANIAEEKSQILDEVGNPEKYALVTIHRDTNTDDIDRLTSIFKALLKIADEGNIEIICPLHPRTKKIIEKSQQKKIIQTFTKHSKIKIIPPVSFFDIIMLEKNSEIVITDSGGVQKEAFFFKKPCIILRDQTEWTELVENGTARTTGADTNKIIEAYSYFKKEKHILKFESIFGNGNAAEYICKVLTRNIK